MKFVVIGGDAAGMSAASRARRTNPDLEVVVFEQGFDVSYSACGMPYNIADPGRGMDKLVVRTAKVFIEKNKINLLTGHRVMGIDRENRVVTGENLEGESFVQPYDRLFIATGGSPVIPDVPGMDLAGVFPLKSLEQGRAIKDFIGAGGVKQAVIVGMGYIGLEMAEALTARGIRVSMVKPRPVLLPWMREELSEVVAKELELQGVEIHPGHAVKKVRLEKGKLQVVCQALVLEGEMVITAVGVTPNSELAGKAGLDLGISDAISVDHALRTSDPRIYAAGDCSDAYHVVTGEKCWIPLALRANRAGWAVADHVCGRGVHLKGVAGTAVFKVFDLQVARTGLSASEASRAGFDPVEVCIKTRSRAHGQPGSRDIHIAMVGDRGSGRLLGVQMVGREGVAHRINAPAVALQERMSVEDFAQTDLAYAPPFGPAWDPLLTCANQLVKRL